MSDPLKDRVEALGAEVILALDASLASLRDHDLAAADTVVRHDSVINDERYSIEEAVTAEMGGALAQDRLRLLIAILYVITDLERMADHASGIAKVALMVGHDGPPVPTSLIALGAKVKETLSAGLKAFIQGDVETARRLCAADDRIDDMYDAVYAEVLATMTENRVSIPVHTYLLWVAHNLERIADRVTNLAERTVYLVTGRVEEINASTP